VPLKCGGHGVKALEDFTPLAPENSRDWALFKAFLSSFMPEKPRRNCIILLELGSKRGDSYGENNFGSSIRIA
jgi:hypothetical protein